MPELLHKSLTAAILRAYYNVYNGTGRIYPERFYDRAMVYDLRQVNLHCRQQPEWSIHYKDKLVGKQILDILIADEVVVEDKVAPALTRLHKAQLFSYLKVTDKQVGLLLNFGSPQPEFQRLYYSPRLPKTSKSRIEQSAADSGSADLVEPQLMRDILGGLFEVHTALGPGFIHRIYANACHHEFRMRGLPAKPQRAIHIYYRDEPIGEFHLAHFRLGDSIAVFPVAIQNTADLGLPNIHHWLTTQQIPLGLVANFYDTELKPLFIKTRAT